MTPNPPCCRFRSLACTVLGLLAVLGIGRSASAHAQELRFADLGECGLESGEVIRECRLGYRVGGRLNADHSNVVLIPSWGLGTSEEVLRAHVSTTGLVDPDLYYVIAVDDLGLGIASSPSNSQTQPGAAFPRVTIGDMVRAQHRLLTEHLGIERIHAVVGYSGGAYQVFEWVTVYPAFAAKAVAMFGTPRRSSHDLLLLGALQQSLEECQAETCERERERFATLFLFLARTPQYYVRNVSREQVPEYLRGLREIAATFPPLDDLSSVIRSAESADITRTFDGSLERAAAEVRAKMLIVVASHDYLVTPEISREFARLTGAQLHETPSDCGHLALMCEYVEISGLVRDFLF
jgi:homoserine O-acetyltransferase/O-succinyltransferase